MSVPVSLHFANNDFFIYSHPCGYEIISHFGFDTAFLWWLYWGSFHEFFGHLLNFFGEIFFSGLLPIKKKFLCYFFVSVLYIFRYNSLTRPMICKYFSPLCELSFQFIDGVFNFVEVQFIFYSVSWVFGVISNNLLPILRSDLSPCLLTKIYTFSLYI